MNNIVRRFQQLDTNVIRKFLPGGKTAALKARLKKADTRKVNMASITTKDNLDRPVYADLYNQLLDSLIARNYPFPQRMAILGTALLEASPNKKGVGGNGFLGLSSERMPVNLINNIPAQITYLLDDLETTHSNNWLDGGKGGIRIQTGLDGYNMFWNANDVNSATLILNKSYIRPADRQQAWDNRTKVANILKLKAK